MNITVSKSDLSKLASRMNTVAERKSTMPVLASVLLRAEANRLHLTATDLYQTLIGSVEADVAKPGSFAVSAKDFTDRVKMLAEGPVEIVLKETTLTLKSKGTARRYTMRGMPGDDFPPIPRPDDNAPIMTVDPGVLSALLSHTIFSVSGDETRVHLNSLLIEWEGGVVRAVSTDGHRLSLYERKTEGVASATLLLPLKSVREVQQISDALYSAPAEDRKPLTIIRSGAQAFFQGGGMTFGVKLVDAQFPPFRQVIPKTSARTVRLPRAQLADAIKAVSVAANNKTGGVRLSFAKGVLSLSSENPDSGDGADEVPYEIIDGKDGALVGLKASYATDILSALAGDEVDVGVSGELDPVVVKPVGPEAEAALFVVMPMRI